MELNETKVVLKLNKVSKWNQNETEVKPKWNQIGTNMEPIQYQIQNVPSFSLLYARNQNKQVSLAT